MRLSSLLACSIRGSQLITGIAAILISSSTAGAADFQRVRIGDADGFGFTETQGLLAREGTPADADHDGLLEPPPFDPNHDGVHTDVENVGTESLPDLDENGCLCSGSDEFDHRSNEEISGAVVEVIGGTDAGSGGSQWTDVGISTNYVSPNPFPDGNPLRPNNPSFLFAVDTAPVHPATSLIFRMVWADGRTPQAVTATFADDSTLSLVPLQGGEVGRLLWLAAALPADRVFPQSGVEGRVRIDVKMEGDANDPFFAIDYAELARSPACGNGLVEDSECCDLGSANGGGSACSATCGCEGVCTVGRTACIVATECSPGEGCCGDRIVEHDEECDDGNLQSGDCCSAACQIEETTGCVPPCPGVAGPHLLSPATMKALFRDRDGDPEFDSWSASRRGKSGDFNLSFGQHVNPCDEETRVAFFENDGSNRRRLLGSFSIASSAWSSCQEKPLGSQDELAKLKDPSETASNPDGVRTALLKEKGNKVSYKFKGSSTANISRPISGSGLVRACIHVGDDAGFAVVRCESKGTRLLKCDSIN